ncbi:MAG TPA: hypothetical protein VFC44_18175 [Candidatus Saccharimonadales bacterium]|nr:hypothetical protein [Candidatus Saccharimonadales bacterium]
MDGALRRPGYRSAMSPTLIKEHEKIRLHLAAKDDAEKFDF